MEAQEEPQQRGTLHTHDGSSAAPGIQRQSGPGIGVSLLIIAGMLLLWYVSQVILLLFAGLLLAILLRIPTDMLSDHTPLSSQVALIVIVFTVLALISIAGVLVAPIVAMQLDQLVQALPRGIEEINRSLQQYTWLQQLPQQIPAITELVPSPGTVLARVSGIFSGIFGLTVNFLVFLVTGLFLAFQPTTYMRGVVQLFPHTQRQRKYEVLQAVGYSLRWWLISRMFSMTVIGISTGVGLAILGVPFALTFGVVSGLLNFIPFVGSILALIPVAIVAITQGVNTLLYVVVFYLVVQTIESYFLTPMVQQRAILIPPVLAITVQLLMIVLTGTLGFLLAVPLTAAGLVLVKLLYLEDMLGDQVDVPRPASAAPVED